ncbi:EIN3-binding F-box protein 1-like [Dioscorea cayenensis subsp. rotundata]|uniref:EIN3-binding F-box protein 1-like n=1 Tax=Dioscorea cayennensis subsp. rotundata TaxID=55577 RepID=A0AB40BBJ2_DIOCR|nr:EIN3-binding F-box protein 1-like [Dioscorea cayenensis subsp. rotundata]
MPALVNCGGDRDIRPGGPLYSNLMESSSLFLSLTPNVDVYCPPRKRSRITAPFILTAPSEPKLALKKPCSIDVLPDECLFEIFRRLPADKDRSASACVSKRWLFLLSSIRSSEIAGEACSKVSPAQQDVSLLNSVKKPLPDLNGEATLDEEQEIKGGHLSRCLEGKEATDVRLASMAVGLVGRGGLGKLSIRGSNTARGVTDVGLAAIAHGCPTLTALSMWDVPFVTDEGLSEIADGCPMLEKLDLCQCPLISDKGLIAVAQKCHNLKSLSIQSCSKVGNEGLQAIGRRCSQLLSISINGCRLVGDQGIAGLVSSASTTLSKIKLHNLTISDVALAVIGHYGKAVTDLVISGLMNVSERGFWVMGNARGMQNLKHLTIISCRGVTDLGLEAIAKGSPSLKQLCLRKCFTLSDNGLNAFSGAAGSLESLQLEECSRVTLFGVLGVLLNCTSKLKTLTLSKCFGIRDINAFPTQLPCCMSLRSLTIRDCPGFSSSSLAVVGRICPKLQQVDLSGLVAATDAGLLPLIDSSESRLVKVNLSGCVNLTDAVVSPLVRAHGETLQLLHLDGCKKVTDASLLAIAENCSVLTDLDMSSCSITDYGVAALASARQFNLQVLSFSGCSKVTRGSLPFLGNMGRSLLGLNLQQCNLIGSQGIASLEEKLWWCDILS